MKENEMGGVCRTDKIKEESTQGLVGNLKEINCLEDLRIDGKMILKWMLHRWEDNIKMDLTRVEGAQTGFIRVSKCTSGRFLQTQAKDLLASQERLIHRVNFQH
jgi:hypothetical protein